MKIGSLFSGYGGLDLAAAEVLGGEVAWHCEWDDAPSKILAHHYPDIPNFRDVSLVDFTNVPPVDVLTGGFPCQDVSLAGRRAGMREGTRSGLWSQYARAIDELKPSLVVIENVRGLLSAEADRNMEPDPWSMGDGDARPSLRALGAVLGDLADLGYDAEWCGVRAADAGAPHGRFRVFVVAHPQDADFTVGVQRRQSAPGQKTSGRARADLGRRGGASSADSDRGRHGSEQDRGGVGNMDGQDDGDARERERARPVARDRSTEVDWAKYAPAIRRWERVSGRVAPSPTLPTGNEGKNRLSTAFVEWMMGLPNGWVTAPEIGLTRNEQLKALGNGVVPQQAALALRTLLVSS